MNRIFKIALLSLFGALSLISCNRNDEAFIAPPIPYAEQYPVDIANIDKFLDEYHMDIVNDNAVFTKITATTPGSTIREQYITPYPVADRIKTVTNGGIDYKIYFIPFKEGNGERPCRVDSVMTAYKGEFIYKKTDATVSATPFIASQPFDEAQNPTWFPLTGVVPGWKEIIPLFKAADGKTTNAGTVTYQNYGAGVMFLPSAFGYYNVSQGIIPSYSPLIFSFKLMELKYVDSDFDRILSKDEDINGNGILTDDDTDGDGRYNYLDQDDDGDGYFTKYEISHKVNDLTAPFTERLYYYPFNGGVDNPATAVDESQGIPACGNVDFTSPTRLRKHLDRNCH